MLWSTLICGGDGTPQIYSAISRKFLGKLQAPVPKCIMGSIFLASEKSGTKSQVWKVLTRKQQKASAKAIVLGFTQIIYLHKIVYFLIS